MGTSNPSISEIPRLPTVPLGYAADIGKLQFGPLVLTFLLLIKRERVGKGRENEKNLITTYLLFTSCKRTGQLDTPSP